MVFFAVFRVLDSLLTKPSSGDPSGHTLGWPELVGNFLVVDWCLGDNDLSGFIR
jgi:hypothetical protein